MSTPQTLAALEAGEYTGTSSLKISPTIATFPLPILSLFSTLVHLDLSSNPSLSTLPASISRLHKLKIAFFSSCSFTVFPPQLAQCRSLEMVAFKNNGMRIIPENAFPRKLKWLILTGNEIEVLPRSIGGCVGLMKCMLAGNRIRELPGEMRACRKLGLLRLSSNRLESLPDWLFEMPELSFLSFAGNPCSNSTADGVTGTNEAVLNEITWTDLAVHQLLGEGASGVISKGTWKRSPSPRSSSPDTNNTNDEEPEKHVAIKLFKGDVTSDGSPLDEMAACISAGQHPNLIDPIGEIKGHPEKRGLVLELIPPHYKNLGQPPTLDSCTRDSFPADATFSLQMCKSILTGIASAACHLHEKGIAHGDLYAHNILIDSSGHALLGDFGAATVYRGSQVQVGVEGKLERMEVFAFGHLVEDLLGLVVREVGVDGEVMSEKDEGLVEGLNALHWRCTSPVVGERPGFREVWEVLDGL